MNFSSTIKYSGISSYSPNANYLAIAKSSSLIIYETEELKIISKFIFNSTISQIEWSSDSALVLIAFYKSGIVEIKAIANSEWTCTINESMSGVSYARWTPDSRKVLIINDFNVRMSIWSLVDKSTVYINGPKFGDKGIAFSSNGYFMALAERKDNKDFIGVYFTGDFSLVSHFVADTYDLSDVFWSKDDTSIVVVDSELDCRIAVYSPTGNLIEKHEPYTGALGARISSFSPNGRYFAVGFNDNKVRLYNSITWKQISELNHNMTTVTAESLTNVFREEDLGGKNKYSKYVECTLPYKFSLSNNNSIVKGIGGSITDIEWSYDSNYLATRSEALPNMVFIWKVNALSLYTIVIQTKGIKEFHWSPKENMLLIVTENAKLYTFTLSNVYIIELVSDLNNNFGATSVIWNSDGRSFIVSDKKQMIIGHPELGDIVGEEEKEGEEEEHEEMENEPKGEIAIQENNSNNESNNHDEKDDNIEEGDE